MKKNDWLLLVSVLLYSYLFYEQSAGINFFLFNIALVVGLLIKNPASLKDKSWLAVAAGSLISSGCIMYYSSSLAIVANVISLSLLSYFSLAPNSSILLALCMEIIVIGSSCVYMFFDWVKRSQNKADKKSKPLYVIIIMTTIIILITILFFGMYQSANPVFSEFTKNINLNFISWPWIFFTLGGLLLMYGFYYTWRIEYFNELDENASNNITEERANKNNFLNNLFKIDTEYLTGVILLVILNMMLLLLNILDLNYLWFDGNLPAEVDHKEFVHNGIGMLITSIVLAIIIILYFFRGRLNYFSNAKYIKVLACFWLAQNAFMIFSSFYRTNMYVEEFGISYKKIGVYVYLGLTLIGLITTYIKVTKLKSNWYLVRVNTWCYFIILVISCVFNWDVIITDFNINKALTENKKLEKYYLADLSFKNLPQLLQLNDTIKEADDFGIRDYYYTSRGTYFYSFKTALDERLFSFMRRMENCDWQSWCKEKSRVMEDVLGLHNRGEIKSLDLSKYYLVNSLTPIKDFSKLEKLNIAQNKFDTIEQLSYFPNLVELDISSNNLRSIKKFPALGALKKLNISNNTNLINTNALKNAPELEELDLSSSMIGSNSLPDLKRLRKLNLSSNPIADFTALTKYKELKELDLMNTFRGTIVFPVLDKLEDINIGSNVLDRYNSRDVFYKIGESRNIRVLKAENNALEKLSDLIFRSNIDPLLENPKYNFPALEELNLSNNHIYNLHDISNLKSLKKLSVANNKITSIKEILALKDLTELNISGNVIKSINGIDSLKNLEVLDVAFCSIVNGIDLISKLNKLTLLRISSNGLKGIKEFTGLSNLKQLYLQGNQITSVVGIEKLTNLEELNLRDNSISDYSPIYSMKKLRTLYVDGMPRQKLLKLKKALPNCTVYDYNPDYYRN